MATVSSARQQEISGRLVAAGVKRTESARLRKEAAKELRTAIPQAVKAGMPITEIAERSSMTRQAVYNLLGKS